MGLNGILILFTKDRDHVDVSVRVVEYSHGDIIKEEFIGSLELCKEDLLTLIRVLALD